MKFFLILCILAVVLAVSNGAPDPTPLNGGGVVQGIGQYPSGKRHPKNKGKPGAPASKFRIQSTTSNFMGMGRPWLFRASIAGNLLLLTYVALYSSSSQDYPPSAKPLTLPQPLQQRSQTFLSNELDPGRSGSGPPSASSDQESLPQNQVDSSPEKLLSSNDNNKPLNLNAPEGVVWDGDDSALGEGIAADLVSPETPPLANLTEIIPPEKLFPCDDLSPRSFYGQRGSYWVLYNYIRASKTFRCDQSITYTTHADFTFLDNLVPLLERWQGPLSLSVYAPGTDFPETIQRIQYLRECLPNSLVKDYVTFHIFFDSRHVPKTKIPSGDPFSNKVMNCSLFNYPNNPPSFGDGITTYKKTKRLPYPVNVARNVAREMASTHYILPSDIELYPNPNLIPDFLEMIRLNDSNIQRPNPKVFVLSIFEVEANVTNLPGDKRELIQMLGNKSAIPFHKYVCADCHRIPKAEQWKSAPYLGGLKVFHVGKRHRPYHHWEPIFIGTKFDPEYDERLSWEGRSDKMTQGYTLCVLDYEFQILDNAFLVHKPGIKRNKVIPKKNPVVAKQNTMIARTILPELKLVYGTRPGCVV